RPRRSRLTSWYLPAIFPCRGCLRVGKVTTHHRAEPDPLPCAKGASVSRRGRATPTAPTLFLSDKRTATSGRTIPQAPRRPPSAPCPVAGHPEGIPHVRLSLHADALSRRRPPLAALHLAQPPALGRVSPDPVCTATQAATGSTVEAGTIPPGPRSVGG